MRLLGKKTENMKCILCTNSPNSCVSTESMAVFTFHSWVLHFMWITRSHVKKKVKVKAQVQMEQLSWTFLGGCWRSSKAVQSSASSGDSEYCVILFPGSVIKRALTLARYEATVWHSAWHPLIQSTVTECRPWQRLRLYNSLWLIVCNLDVSSGPLCSYFTNMLFIILLFGFCMTCRPW